MPTILTKASGVTVVERTVSVVKNTPSEGEDTLVIHREQITLDADGAELCRVAVPFAFNEPIAKVESMDATVAYTAAINKAASLDAVAAAEVVWHDSLIEERAIEKVAEEAQRLIDQAKKPDIKLIDPLAPSISPAVPVSDI